MPGLEQNKENVSSSETVKRGPDFTLIQSELDQVQQRIKALLSVTDEEIRQCIDYLLESKGKMIRPALVLLAGASIGTLDSNHIDLAAMVELIHRASLLHDDIIDAAQIRRARQTANALWGNTTAVLLGDFLLSRAFSLDVFVRVEKVQQVLSQTARDICCGELKQNFRKGRWDMSLQEYYQIIESKTAMLFQSSCRLGAMASGALPEQLESLSHFGRSLGIAFQISDDLLDIVGTSDTAGKTLGTDLKQGKLTLPVIHWIQSSREDRDGCIEMLLKPDNDQDILRYLRQSGSLDYAMMQVKNHVDNAVEKIRDLKQTPVKKALVDLADYIASRVR